MPKYDVAVIFDFKGVEARDRMHARELCDSAIGTVKVDHPTGGKNIASEVEIEKVDE